MAEIIPIGIFLALVCGIAWIALRATKPADPDATEHFDEPPR
jgi:hypothetical protein